MAEYEFSVDEFEELASRLDALGDEIGPSERALLFAVFKMAADNIAKHSAVGQEPVNATGSTDTSNVDPDLESVSRTGGTGFSVEAQVQALEERVGRLETSVFREGGLESLGDRVDASPTVQLRTEGGGVPRLSEGFLRSFSGGQAARVMAADDVGVGVNIGVMF